MSGSFNSETIETENAFYLSIISVHTFIVIPINLS